MMSTKLFYFSKMLRKIHLSFFARMIDLIVRILIGCEIHSKMNCGAGIILAHNGCGIVINEKAVIGNNVLIFQNVTIGGRKGSGAPVIMDDVVIGAGAVIIGDVLVGKGAQIGANAVVLCDVPEYSTAVGVPARIIIHR